jgi:hypothetical protein
LKLSLDEKPSKVKLLILVILIHCIDLIKSGHSGMPTTLKPLKTTQAQRETAQRHYSENKERKKEKMREYYQRNKEALKKLQKQRYTAAKAQMAAVAAAV